jgi:DNA-binding MarR family transcriptional regulator
MTKQLDVLGNLFGSATRVKLLKFFLLNTSAGYSIDDIAARLRVKPSMIKHELAELAKAGLVKSKIVVVITTGSRKVLRKKKPGYIANQEFALRGPLRELLIDSGSIHLSDLPKKFAKAGRIGLLVASGFFLHDQDRATDLMIVGNNLNRKNIETEIKKIEADIGKELKYAVFDTEEFVYRLNMYDKLIRDVLDFPHEKLINKIDRPELR